MFKEKIFAYCVEVLEKKVVQLKQELDHLAESARSETKSTAGDKHETGRAMVQLEQEKTGAQLKEAEMQLNTLKQIDISIKSDSIIKGSLVECGQGYFFIASAIGKITVDEKIVFVISPQSPLGVKLLGLKEKEKTEMNGMIYLIKSIL